MTWAWIEFCDLFICWDILSIVVVMFYNDKINKNCIISLVQHKTQFIKRSERDESGEAVEEQEVSHSENVIKLTLNIVANFFAIFVRAFPISNFIQGFARHAIG